MTGPSHFFDVAGSSSDELAKTFSWSKRLSTKRATVGGDAANRTPRQAAPDVVTLTRSEQRSTHGARQAGKQQRRATSHAPNKKVHSTAVRHNPTAGGDAANRTPRQAAPDVELTLGYLETSEPTPSTHKHSTHTSQHGEQSTHSKPGRAKGVSTESNRHPRPRHPLTQT